MVQSGATIPESKDDSDAPPPTRKRKIDQRRKLPKLVSELYESLASSGTHDVASFDQILSDLPSMPFSIVSSISRPLFHHAKNTPSADLLTLALAKPLTDCLTSLVTSSIPYPVKDLVDRVQEEILTPISERIDVDDEQGSKALIRAIGAVANCSVALRYYSLAVETEEESVMISNDVFSKWKKPLRRDAGFLLCSLQWIVVARSGDPRQNKKFQKTLNSLLSFEPERCRDVLKQLEWLVDFCQTPEQMFQLACLYPEDMDCPWNRLELVSAQVVRVLKASWVEHEEVMKVLNAEDFLDRWYQGSRAELMQVLRGLVEEPVALSVTSEPIDLKFDVDGLPAADKSVLILSYLAQRRCGSLKQTTPKMLSLLLAVSEEFPLFAKTSRISWCFSASSRKGLSDELLVSLFSCLPGSLLSKAASHLLNISDGPTSYPRTLALVLNRLWKKNPQEEALSRALKMLKKASLTCSSTFLPLMFQLSIKKAAILEKISGRDPESEGDFVPISQIISTPEVQAADTLDVDSRDHFLRWATKVFLHQLSAGRKVDARSIHQLVVLLPHHSASNGDIFQDFCHGLLGQLCAETGKECSMHHLEPTLQCLTGVANAVLSPEKSEYRKDLFLNSVLPVVLLFLSRNSKSLDRVIAVVDFLSSLHERSCNVSIPSSTSASILASVASLLKNSVKTKSVAFYRAAARFLLTMVISQSSAIFPARVALLGPPFLSCFESLLVLSPNPSDGETADAVQGEAEICKTLNVLERLLAQVAQEHKKEAHRVAHYWIGMLVDKMATRALTYDVKLAASMCVNVLLSITDEHGIAALRVQLAPGCKDLFLKLHNDYNRHAKYRGEV